MNGTAAVHHLLPLVEQALDLTTIMVALVALPPHLQPDDSVYDQVNREFGRLQSDMVALQARYHLEPPMAAPDALAAGN